MFAKMKQTAGPIGAQFLENFCTVPEKTLEEKTISPLHPSGFFKIKMNNMMGGVLSTPLLVMQLLV